MRVWCFGFALALSGLVGLLDSGAGSAHGNVHADDGQLAQMQAQAGAKQQQQQQQQPITEVKSGKARGRVGGGSQVGGTWRLLVVLAQSQPSRAEVQRAWDDAVRELVHLDVELGWLEAGQPQEQRPQQPSHPTALVSAFCHEIQRGKTILLLVLGGGPPARFLLTAANSIRMPSLWMPFTHRDFVRQGREDSLESRIGSSSAEMGAAAAALMHKAHWHAFNLLLDPSLMPLDNLVKEQKRRPKSEPEAGETATGSLLPRTIVYLPVEERKLSARLRRLSEENGRGSVVVLACDLANARKVLQLAARHEMLAGRFLWLWLDLKAELRAGESSAPGPQTAGGAAPAERPPGPAHEQPGLQQQPWRAARPAPEPPEEEPERGPAGSPRSFMPVGMLALRAAGARAAGPESLLGRGLREAAAALDRAMLETRSRYARFPDARLRELFAAECAGGPGAEWLGNEVRGNVSRALARRLREHAARVSRAAAEFQLLNLQGQALPGNRTQLRWSRVGAVRAGREVRLDTITWPGGGIVPAYARRGGERVGMPYYRVVTALSPPFAMVMDLQEGACLRGLLCRHTGVWRCCFGYSMDLLRHVSQDLEFRFELHVARDGLFGRRRGRNGTWNGIVGELVSGRAQLAFAALSVYSHRSQVIDFSTPYYFSSVSLLIAPKERNHISLLAFLQPFSPELWIAVFTSLNITAMFVAAYEWFSPFGLNPWGRQRSKNFSIASALWVMWGLLCGHLVAFKAPKSWPNKFLINVWGGFSVIFVASYTANIAALIAGLFFHSTDNNYKSRSLLLQRVAAPRASAAEFYVQQADPRLWSYMARFSVGDVADGVARLLNDSLDVLIADTPIIDYYRATDNGCRLEKIGDSIKEDTYAVGLSRGHPLRESISRAIANYSSTGLLDILQERWYGGLPCARGAASGLGFDGQPHHGGQPRPLGVASVAGVFCLLGLGVALGLLILVGEHIFYRYSLPKLRQCPKNSIWRSRNVMFFSQKLYRFINCVELVSPHHAARELVHTVRQGQITSLFQKSVKRSDLFQKEHEQRRRRKSKAQFFEMIQEIRRAQQEEKVEAAAAAAGEQSRGAIRKELAQPERRSRSRSRSRSKSPRMPSRGESRSRSSGSLEPGGAEAARPREFTLSSSNLRARSPLELVGRRLSHGDGGSPPRTPQSTARQAAQRGESLAASPRQQRSPARRGQSFPVFASSQVSRSPLLSPSTELTSAVGRKLSREWGSGIDLSKSSEGLGPPAPACLGAEPPVPAPQQPQPQPQQQQQQQQPTPREREQRRKRVHGDAPAGAGAGAAAAAAAAGAGTQPTRRARSHESRDKGASGEKAASPRFPVQSSVGGQTASQRAKRQLESELKAILTARAHHLQLQPP